MTRKQKINWDELIKKQQKVIEYIKSESYEEAIKICQDMIKKKELNTWPYGQLIRIYEKRNEWALAHRACEEALQASLEYPNQVLKVIHEHSYRNKLIEIENHLYHPEKIVTPNQILEKLLAKPRPIKKPRRRKSDLRQIYDEYSGKLESASLKWSSVSSVNLSIKYELGLPLSGRDVFSLSDRENNQIIKDNVDTAISFLEDKIRSFEEEQDVDLLSLITENYALDLGYNIPFWWLYPLRERPNLIKKNPSLQFRELDAQFYDYSRLGEFLLVVNEWVKEAENFVREAQGLPRIGEGFLNETLLFNMVKDHYEPQGYTVIQHAHPPFLGRQELDIYIPELKLGIEYQGAQHFEAIDFFGGEKGLEHRKDLDERKRQLCRENNVTLIEFKYDEELTKNNVLKKINQ